MPEVAEIFTELPKLTQTQLRELRVRTNALLAKEPITATVIDNEIYTALSQVLLENRVMDKMPLSKILECKKATNYKNGAIALSEYVEMYLKPKNKLERLVAYKMLLRMLVQRINRYNQYRRSLGEPMVSINWLNILVRVNKINDEVEREFPGYKNAGLLHVLIDRKSLGNA